MPNRDARGRFVSGSGSSSGAIRAEGLEEALAQLLADLGPALDKAVEAIAHEVEDRIAPYPPAPAPRNAKRWYERGFGPRWRRKDGGVGGRQTSEMLGRRWAIQTAGFMQRTVQNLASYAPWVHSKDQQARIHEKAGWLTDEGVKQAIEQDGTADRIVTQAIKGALKVEG